MLCERIILPRGTTGLPESEQHRCVDKEPDHHITTPPKYALFSVGWTSLREARMSTGALRNFLSDRVDQLEYDDPSVKRILTLVAGKVTTKGDPVHKALQAVFDRFGEWK